MLTRIHYLGTSALKKSTVITRKRNILNCAGGTVFPLVSVFFLSTFWSHNWKKHNREHNSMSFCQPLFWKFGGCQNWKYLKREFAFGKKNTFETGRIDCKWYDFTLGVRSWMPQKKGKSRFSKFYFLSFLQQRNTTHTLLNWQKSRSNNNTVQMWIFGKKIILYPCVGILSCTDYSASTDYVVHCINNGIGLFISCFPCSDIENLTIGPRIEFQGPDKPEAKRKFGDCSRKREREREKWPLSVSHWNCIDMAEWAFLSCQMSVYGLVCLPLCLALLLSAKLVCLALSRCAKLCA